MPAQPLGVSTATAGSLVQRALDPAASAVVEACAGSGKTWLLVARIVRLLLAGARPGEILAITFTRKAAQEMATRLREGLALLATADPATVHAFVRARGLDGPPDPAVLARARGLYEAYLTAQPSVTVSTFHSWFMQLLRSAPLDAGAPGDVTLLDLVSPLVNEAFQRFGRAAARDPSGDAARGLAFLQAECGPQGARALLTALLHRRADWWAFRGDREEQAGIDAALSVLREGTRVKPGEDPAHGFLAANESGLATLAALLERNADTDQARAAAYAEADDTEARFAAARAMLLKQDGAPLARKAAKAQRQRLGADGEERLLALHASLAAAMQEALQDRIDQAACRLNAAALAAGNGLIAAYQALKDERQALDHADVEWRASRLVASGEHALYMQFKLDARYRHVLLDEFQDTNPLQWNVLTAWFDAAVDAGLAPTVFMVGDPKQSIYRFRRAEPRLFGVAADWLGARFGAPRIGHNESRRCAPAIIEVVNRVFAGEDGFSRHSAHAADAPGGVEVLALVNRSQTQPPRTGGELLRDPLATALELPEDRRHAEEAALLVQRLAALNGRVLVRDPQSGEPRPLRHADVMLLVRARTHLAVYERALRDAGIPFVSSRQGGLLDTLEVRDMVALLAFLVSPASDLDLAHALRSPLFAASDDDLARLAAQGDGSWWQRLQGLADASPALARARALLQAWLARADALPVHDQLDRIWFEGDVPARYAHAVPVSMRLAVAANLQAFMRHALDTDAGRYPSLPRFIAELRALRRAPDEEAPDEGVIGDPGDAVRILTVHGAKGLEAPLVWLLDATAGPQQDRGNDVLIDWPPAAPAPAHVSIVTRREAAARSQQRLRAEEAARAAREDLNLLYVAMTRAREWLIVSGVERRGGGEWYRRVRAAVALAAGVTDAGNEAIRYGELPIGPAGGAPAHGPARPQTMPVAQTWDEPQPTGTRRANASPGEAYGTLLHAIMEHVSVRPALTLDRIRRLLPATAADLGAAWSQARAILAAPDLERFFAPGRFRRAWNELALVDAQGALRRIDRLVELDDAFWVLDYKTGDGRALAGTARELEYRAQVADYCALVRTLHPGRTVRGLVVFADGTRISVDD